MLVACTAEKWAPCRVPPIPFINASRKVGNAPEKIGTLLH